MEQSSEKSCAPPHIGVVAIEKGAFGSPSIKVTNFTYLQSLLPLKIPNKTVAVKSSKYGCILCKLRPSFFRSRPTSNQYRCLITKLVRDEFDSLNPDYSYFYTWKYILK